MLSFDEIVGQPMAVDLLRGLVATGRVPHALLFQGPEAVGKATVARSFAAALLCERPEAAPCGECRSCTLLESGNHPDFLLVGRLTKDEARKDKEKSRLITQKPDVAEADLATQILIDQIRTLNGLVGLTPRQGRRRVFIIDPADRLNVAAENALLKTLEEPPERSVMILVTFRPHVLLPTVRSRCFNVGFVAMRTPELAAELEQRGLPREEAATRAALSGGRLGCALELDVEARRARRDEVLDMLVSLSSGPRELDKLPAMAAAFAGKEEPTLLDGLDLAEGLLRDAARAGMGESSGELLHADLAESLARLGERLGPTRAAQLVACVERLRGYLRINANRTLLAESLLAGVAGAPLPGDIPLF